MIYENIDDLPELLPFKDDYIFKTLLTREGADIVRNSMLSAFTGLQIVKSKVIENEPPMDISAEEKQIRLDVNCVTSDGEKINIEMQAKSMFGDNSENGYENLCCRSIYYTSKLFIGQKAKHYSELNQTFNITVCDFGVFDDDKFIHRFHYSDGKLVLNDITCIIYVELPKIKSVFDKHFDEMTPEERWAFMIEYADDKKFSARVNEFKTREEFDMAMNILSAVSRNELERMEFISHQKYLNDLEHNKDAAAWMEQRGLKRGLQQGLLQAAVNFLKLGLTVEQVAQGTDLPIAEVEELKNNL